MEQNKKKEKVKQLEKNRERKQTTKKYLSQ